MCYGTGCPYEREDTGTCYGDWNKEDAACKMEIQIGYVIVSETYIPTTIPHNKKCFGWNKDKNSK